QAARCATINSAIRLRRDDLGLVAAGRRADMVALGDLPALAVERGYAGGRQVAAQGRMLIDPKPAVAPPLASTMNLARPTPAGFSVPLAGIKGGRRRIRTIKGARFNTWSEIEVEVRNGFAVVPAGLSVMTVIHRHGRSNAGPQSVIIEGWG